ncbi:MAG: rod shape-determining protein MreC [Actinobacteria bacterium]|nr:rod shape-determining protein MreC [Actinomycetota bacterium]
MAVYRRSNRRRSILVLLLLTAVTLITLDTRGNGSGITDSVRDAAQDAIDPAQEAVGDVLDPIDDWFDGVVRSGDLKEENAKLRRDLARALGQASESRASLRENRELKALADLTFAPGLPGVDAQVVAASPGNFEETVGIDKGSNEGITADMPVVAGDGLVGRIADVSGRRATVLMLTDPKSGVGVRLEDSGTLGVADGRQGSDLLSVDVPLEVKVRKGELVFTSGTEPSLYPGGIPVGTVVSVLKPAGALAQSLLVRPLVDIGRSTYVRVLLWPGGGQGG